MHKVYLENCRFKSNHGVFDEEKIIGGEFVVDLIVSANFESSILEDDLDGTVNYAELYQLVASEMSTPSKLLEHLAGRIMKSIFNRFPTVNSIQIKVCKTHPPIVGEIGAVCIEIKENR